MDPTILTFLFAALTFIYPVKYYLRMVKMRFMFYVSVLMLIAVIFHMIAYYGLINWGIIFYDLSEFLSNVFILISAVYIFSGLHDYVYEDRFKALKTIVPLPFVILAETELFWSSYISFFLLGGVIVLNILSLVYAYKLYRARREGSLYWLILFGFIFLLSITVLVYSAVEILEVIGGGALLEMYESLFNFIKAFLYLVLGLVLLYSAYYHNRNVRPLIEKLANL